MLQDPENTEILSFEVRVPFDEDKDVLKANAWRVCRQTFVADELTEVIDAQPKTKTPNRSNQVKWICTIRRERRITDDDNT